MSSSVNAHKSLSVYCSHTFDILQGVSIPLVNQRTRDNDIPLHALRPFLDQRSHLAQLLPQHANSLYSGSDVVGQASSNLPPHNVCQLRPIAIGADHDLQWPITVDAAKIEVALWRDISNVGRDASLLAQFVYLRRGFRVVDCGQDHVDSIEIRGFELAVDIVNLLLLYPIGDFFVEALARGHEGDFGVGVEHVDDATGGDLDFCQSSTACEHGEGPRLTSPPPTTSTRLLRICHARMSEPPPWISGYGLFAAAAMVLEGTGRPTEDCAEMARSATAARRHAKSARAEQLDRYR
ncbi:hypothetical protein J1614_006579 [Plenodomus biglobosus]|nr:hypothetical protein J1614_006579 [Plenodomus biglobosus]